MIEAIEHVGRSGLAVKPAAPRFGLLLSVAVMAACFLLARSFYLQVVYGDDFRTRAEENRVTPELLPAPRGVVYDAFGHQLVENISSTDVILDPALLPSREDEGYLLENLPQLLPISADDVRAALERCRTTQRPVLLAKALEHDQVLKLEEAAKRIEGTRLVSSLVRKYPYSLATAHVLGYTSAVTADELTNNSTLAPTDITGKLGIEQRYDKELRGTHGISYVEVNAVGKPLVDLGKKDAVSGQDLHLTMDIELQEYIYSLLSDRDEKEQKEGRAPTTGAVVVMNPQDGSVTALASYPSFDPNVFSQPALRPDAGALFTDKRQPLFNRAITGTYPSGSTIKPFLAAAGLQEGVISKDTTILSTGGLTIGPWHFLDWKSGGHGRTDINKAIAESVNTFFYLLAGGDETHTGLGAERIAKYLGEFGWGKLSGIDLPSEAAGFIPTPAWKESVLHESWYIGDTYHLGIGQGNVQVTPLQIAVGTASLANGKHTVQPHMVQNTSLPKEALPVATAHIQTVRAAMRETVVSGSGRSLSALPINLAGKTGTAQIGGTENTHAWFTSFGPYESPQYVVTVLLERGGAGDVDAVPIARLIWEWIVAHRLQTA